MQPQEKQIKISNPLTDIISPIFHRSQFGLPGLDRGELSDAKWWQQLCMYVLAWQALIFSNFNLSSQCEDALILTPEQLENEAQLPQTGLKDSIKECASNLRRYFNACKNVRWFYGVLILPMVIWISLMTLLARHILPPLSRRRWDYWYERFKALYEDPRNIRDLALDVRPLVLGWLTMCPPTALCLMFSHYVTSAFRAITRKEEYIEKIAGVECIRFPQFVDKQKRPWDVSFFNSPAFPLITLSIFALGLPGMLSSWIYFHFGIDPRLGYPSHDPQFKKVFLQIQLYIYPLSWCLAVLFFRSYFTWALSFTSREHDIEIYDDVIKSLPIKGWFRDFGLLRAEHIPFQIAWKNVQSITYHNLNLPAEQLKSLPKIFDPFLKMSKLIESISRNLELKSDFLEIKDKTRTLTIRLAELSKEQKAQLFFCLHKYAPSIYLDATVQEALVGSTVLREPRYTQIWFDVLTSKNLDSDVPSLQTGSRLHGGDYEVLEKLGSGGQAVVYLCANKQNEKVVLKEYQLVPGESLDVLIESAKTFENESTLLGQLDCDGIVRLKDMFYETSRVYLVLEYVEGVNLRQFVEANGVLTEERVIELAKKMSDILIYLHGQTPELVHRDFTPDNIILMPDGNIKLIDFSVAESGKSVKSGECAGKHAYSPPEQFRGEACPQSDIYALGATLYFLLVGEDPVPISISSPLAKRADLSSKLNALVEYATNLSLEQRCQSARWLRSELDALSSGHAQDSSILDNTAVPENSAEMNPEPINEQNAEESDNAEPVKVSIAKLEEQS